ncbi:hypothetical protein [Vibrio chagasii]|uniref:hypothetical protein n=1 Tax=Vibrio chagasii TaxID=170679 RepID=UPI0022852856|nr:hypothetical protein [Vibrio chagasii]MCY9824551.1 hypothetical protein [Vibrio chagasii]
MLTQKLIIACISLAAISGSFFLGTQLGLQDRFTVDPQYQGVWEGQGTTEIAGQRLTSFVTIIVNKQKSRLSIKYVSGNDSFTVDGTLLLRTNHQLSTYFDFVDRKVGGLDTFIENTGISIPPSTTLLSTESWRLEDDTVFFNINANDNVYRSLILNKKH